MQEAPHEALDLFVELDRLRPLLQARRWAELERTAQEVCGRLAGAVCTARIAAVDTASYEAALRRCAMSAAQSCPPDARFVFFELEPDEGWESTFFFCPEGVSLEEEREDEWACDWLHHVEGPELQPFASLYEEYAASGRDASATGAALYLLIRTVCACGRALSGVDFGARTVCIAFHDRDEVLHVRKLG